MSTIVELAGAVSLAGSASAIAALAYLHVAPIGLSPRRTAVSQYGISPYRAWYRVMTISMGIAGASLAVALAGSLHRLAGTSTVVVLLAIFSVCRAVISWFPMDAPDSARTSTGATHGVLAAITFLAAAISAIRLCRVLEQVPRLDELASISRGLGWAMVLCFALMFLSRLGPDLRRWFGAIERGFYVAVLAWLIVLAVACATGQL